MYGKGIGDAFQFLLILALVSLLGFVLIGGYEVVKIFTGHKHTTNHIVVPDRHIKTIDGVSDTTYVYKFK